MPAPSARTALFSGLAMAAALVSAQAEDAQYDDMGPAAFMWPPDRVWSAAADNHGPCGSKDGVTSREEFPLENGKIALVAQDESWDVELSISYSSDPKSNSDFEVLIDGDHMREKMPGHTCVDVDDPPATVKAGDVATFQVRYIADWDKPENQTFYACADVKFVEVAKFATEIPCFNATNSKGDDAAGPDFDYHGHEDDDDDDDKDGSSSSSSSSSSSDSSSSESGTRSSGGSKGLSGGAIAGIVVGVVGGLSLIAIAGLILYRRRQKNARMARQEQSARGVKWTSDGNSQSSVRMDSIPR